MIVCDGCKSEECFPLLLIVSKQDSPKKKKMRQLIKIDMACCDKCITRLLSRLGYMKKYHDFFEKEKP